MAMNQVRKDEILSVLGKDSMSTNFARVIRHDPFKTDHPKYNFYL